MITEQDNAKKKLQKIKYNFKDANSAVKEGNLEKAVNKLFDGVTVAQDLAYQVDYLEKLTKYKLAGHLSHSSVSKAVEPLFNIANKIKDQDNKYNSHIDFIIGVAYLAQRNYALAARYLRAAKNAFEHPKDRYDALLLLGDAYGIRGLKKRCRETYIEAMLLMPRNNSAFQSYASGVMRREGCCVGLNYYRRKKIINELRSILAKNKAASISNIDKKLVSYVTKLGREFREYNYLPVPAFGAKTG